MLNIPIDRSEFMIKEQRLQKYLDVDYFMEPPEYRDDAKANNAYLPVPYFRFPLNSYCTYNKTKDSCGRIKRLSEGDKTVRPLCQYCEVKSNKKSPMTQVNLVVACKGGHIDEFPWYEWAHNSPNPTCGREHLAFRQSAGTGIRGQSVKCLACNKSNNMSYGFQRLLELYGPCKGMKPWHGPYKSEPCDKEVEGIFSNQISSYQPIIKSALSIPIDAPTEIQDIDAELDNNRAIKNSVYSFEADYSSSDTKSIVEDGLERLLKRDDGRILKELSEYSHESIKKAFLGRIYGGNEEPNESDAPETDIEFRYQEYDVLKKGVNNKYLRTESFGIEEYSEETSSIIKNIVLVKSILETKVLAGFTRRSPSEVDEEKAKKLLWENYPSKPNRWLPAVKGHGEGIFIEFNEKVLEIHAKRKDIKERISILQNSQDKIESGPLQNVVVSFEHLFIHTLSHLLINEISFEAGYSAASISERMYVDPFSDKDKMFGLFIYTSEGDSEGTMGGLVGVGQPGRFDDIVRNAVVNSQWCSTDPVCNEVIPQNPYSLNLGACHSCSLLPETSCELLNSYLDRAVISGTQSNAELGLFYGSA